MTSTEAVCQSCILIQSGIPVTWAFSASRQPTLCPLNNQLHVTELFRQLFFYLIMGEQISSRLASKVRTLGVLGPSWTLASKSLVVRTTSIGWRDRPRLKKNAMARRGIERVGGNRGMLRTRSCHIRINKRSGATD